LSNIKKINANKESKYFEERIEFCIES